MTITYKVKYELMQINNKKKQKKKNIVYYNLLSRLDTQIPLVWPRQQCGGLVPNRISRNGSSSGSQSAKKPRRRVATIAQRRAANIRERRRMFNLNEAFDKLRRKVRQ